MLTVRRCPVCASDLNTKIGDLALTYQARFDTEHYELLSCPRCDIIFQSPLPTQHDFKTMYEDNGQFTSSEYRDAEKVRGALEYYGNGYKNMSNIVGRSSGVRLLEIGAGLAWMCRAGKQNGDGLFTVAQDVTNECVEECTWADQYFVGPVDDKRIEANAPYDFASLTHVIEHLPDPVQTLRRLRELLRLDGCIFVTAPHRPEGWETASPIGTWASWSYNHVPAHLQYFSRVGMERAAANAQLSVIAWSLHENGQAFEAILRPCL